MLNFRTKSGFSPLVFLSILSVFAVSRVFVIAGFDGELSTSILLRGFISDVFIALCLVVILGFLPRSTRLPIYIILLFVLSLVCVANVEHILAMNSAVSIRAIHFLKDEAALHGALNFSVHTRWLLASLSLMTLTSIVLGVWFRERIKNSPVVSPVAAVFCMVFGAILFAWPVKFAHSFWQQSNPIAENLLREWRSLTGERVESVTSKESRSLFRSLNETDLDGIQRYQGDKKNILLILVEGVSGHHVYHPNDLELWQDKAQMPGLTEASKANTRYTHFIAPQVQTDRGEYAFICGDLPNLVSAVSKMTMIQEMNQLQERYCLPKILQEHGYTTSYLQAASMEFMGKNVFMPAAGFEQSNGTPWFKPPYFKHAWGVGDLDFFKQSQREVDRLQSSGKPWFLTMLTIGTHHNYGMPEEYIDPDIRPYANAVLHADEQVMQFISELDAKGILDDTLVIVSADESQGAPNDSTHLTKNWIPFVVFDKGVPAQDINELFSQTDFSLSILDYLGLADKTQVLPPGRSIFRSYATRRDVFFSRYYDDSTYWYSKDNVLLKCDLSYSKCHEYRYPDDHLFWNPGASVDNTVGPQKIGIAKYISSENDWDFTRVLSNDTNDIGSGAWLSHFYLNRNLTGKELIRRVDKIDFNWTDKAPYPGFSPYEFSVRWYSCLNVEQDSVLQVELMADEGAKLFIDGNLKIDAWKDKTGVAQKHDLSLAAGVHHVQLDYFAFYWSSKVKLKFDVLKKQSELGAKNINLFSPAMDNPLSCEQHGGRVATR